jgi:sulfonate dioxygenase
MVCMRTLHILGFVLTFVILVVYNDSSRRPDPSAFSKLELWHSDVRSFYLHVMFLLVILTGPYQVSYEIQPPSVTSLKVITGPEYGKLAS